MFSANDPILECVPNFSEGRDPAIIEAIGNAIRGVPDVKLLHVDSGFDANRTVYTFAGKPFAVLEAAYRAVQKASELIDMRKQHGEHPRMGACDVCPLIPVRNMTLEEVVALSHQLGAGIGKLGIPVYLYEFSATRPERKKLSYLRKGEYESMALKMQKPEWVPDFGPNAKNEKFGMMALGARKFLIAYNINLKSGDTVLTKRIAECIRESGNGKEPGLLKNIQAIGWFMEEYQCAQVSCNLSDFEVTSLKELFDTVDRLARDLGTKTNGSELIGLVPEKALLSGFESTEAAVRHLGLDVLQAFDPETRILERALMKD